MYRRRSAREDLSDEVLGARSRDGDDDSFAELYRRHLAVARRTARCILHSANDVDDVVAEAFTGVLAALRNGKGPRDNFRAYLLACVRNRCYARRPPTPIGDELVESLTPAFEDPERYVEADTVARAFASLRPRWQRTLWLTEVEQLSAADVAADLQLAPNATAALAMRARQAFAAAYLSEHLTVPPATVDCARVGPKLGAFVRNDLGTAERTTVAQHVAECHACTQAVDHLEDLNASLRSLQGPGAGLAAVGAGTGVLIATSTVGGGAVGSLLAASVFAKVAAALLLVIPTAAIVSRRLSASADAATPHPAVAVDVAASASGRAPSGATGASVAEAGSPTVTGGPGRVGADGAGQPSPSLSQSAAQDAAGLAVAAVLGGARTIEVPAVGAPAITLPPTELPGVALPGVSLPGVALPGVSLPGVALPGVTGPILLPGVSLPGPPIPPLTLPPITLPAITVPAITVPAITVPPVTLPPITTPPITIPRITLPPIGILPLG